MSFYEHRNQKILTWVSWIILFTLLAFALLRLPLTIDYTHYSTSTRAFLAGDSRLYDEATNSYYYLPWGLLVTIPLSFLPDTWGQALLSLLSIAGVLLSLRLLVDKVPWWVYILAMVNLYTLNMVVSGQWDGIAIGACGVAWMCAQRKLPSGLGLSLILLTTKPTNTLLAAVLLCVYVLKTWKFPNMLKALYLPAIVLSLSFITCGVDWPLRYVSYLRNTPPLEMYNLSLWKGAHWFSWVVILLVVLWLLVFWYRIGINRLTLSLGLLSNLLISPYVLSYHFVGSYPALGWLAKRHWILPLIPWGLMVFQVFLVANSEDYSGFIFCPLFIWILCVIVYSTKSGFVYGSVIDKC